LPDALTSRAALVDVIAVDDVGVAGVSSGDVGALVLGCGLGELVALAQADARATANRQAARRMSWMMRSGRGSGIRVLVT
jgi:hypothetical protein